MLEPNGRCFDILNVTGTVVDAEEEFKAFRTDKFLHEREKRAAVEYRANISWKRGLARKATAPIKCVTLRKTCSRPGIGTTNGRSPGFECMTSYSFLDSVGSARGLRSLP
jgi:hypothetical protein